MKKEEMKNDYEVEEKKKKIHEAEMYLLSYYHDLIIEKELSKVTKNFDIIDIFVPKVKKELPNIYKEAVMLLEEAKKVEEKKEQFITTNNLKFQEVYDEFLVYGFDKKDVINLACCNAKDDYGKLFDFFNSGKDFNEKKLLDLRENMTDELFLELEGLKRGDKNRIFDNLKKGLEYASDRFKRTKDKSEAVKWSFHVKNILDIVSKVPEFKKETKIDDSFITELEKIKDMGTIIKKGVDAIEKMARSALVDQVELDELTKMNLAKDVLCMSVIMSEKEKEIVAPIKKDDRIKEMVKH